ncbi:20064_t:CDS:2, partial [Gigaspora margarita]
ENISNPNGLTLWSHTATLVDNYMIVAFGNYGFTNYFSTIYMLDVSKRDSYIWVTDFIPSTMNTTNFSN